MIKKILNLFLKSNCPLCDNPSHDYICPSCQKKLEDYRFNDCFQFWQGDLPVFVWGSYDGLLKLALARMKYDNYPQIGEEMGYYLAQSWLDQSFTSKIKNLVVIPIPLHPKKLQSRGFNQAEIIARSFCELTGYSLELKGLLRVRETSPMFGLSREERSQNVLEAFTIGKSLLKRLPQNPILLIDDIYTTGTTVKEAAKILRFEGIEVLGVGAMATSKK